MNSNPTELWLQTIVAKFGAHLDPASAKAYGTCVSPDKGYIVCGRKRIDIFEARATLRKQR